MIQTHLRRPTTTLLLLAFAQLIIALDYNIVFVALPRIGEDLPFTASGLQWVVSGYAVIFGGFLLLGGRLADIVGRRRLFITGLALYGVSSLIGGCAGEPWMLVVARAGQGLGGAFLSPATLSLVTTLFTEPRSRNRAIGIWAAAGSTGMVIGSLLGGVLTSAYGWESVFLVNVPLVLVGIVGALTLLPRDPADPRKISLDIPGAVSSTAGVLAFVYGMVQAPERGWLSLHTLIPLLIGVSAIAIFTRIERHTKTPLIPLTLFRDASLRLGTLTTFLFMASFGAVPFFLTTYLQQVVRLSPFATGIIFVLPSVCVLMGTIIGGRLNSSRPSRLILKLSWLIGGVGALTLVALMAFRLPLWTGVVPLTILSLAQGVIFTVMFAIATSTIPGEHQGVGSGIATSGQQIGGAVGLAVLLVAAVAAERHELTAGSANIDLSVAGMLGIAFLMMIGLFSNLIPTRDRQPRGAEEIMS